MNEITWMYMPVALATGFLCGLIYFGGLWWTVRKGLSSAAPALWFLVSFLLRTAATLTGFYFASHGHLGGLLLCLAGFLGARMTVNRVTRA
jgi:F1F0 ATPase subunit 2